MRLAIAAFLALLAPAAAQQRAEYRGFWVDTFNTALNNHADVAQVVAQARAATANQIYAQVRRRGDAWYLDSLEPKPDGVNIAPGFDPLQDLIVEAHASGIEVHAFVIVGAIWNNPAATIRPPTDPNHAFNRHGGFDPATGTIAIGPENWLTRSLLPDIPMQGHRFGNDFWLDFGHPDAAAYTVDVLMRLVRGYNIDGLHLDRIRYPDFSAAGQTPATGANIGYNTVSVARFQKRHGIPVNSQPPAPGDALWAQWRRDQVTNLVRRIYLNAAAIRPNLKISAALIAYGGGPATDADWVKAEAYWRVYQDWRAWTEEGILDLAIPMVYKRQDTQANMFEQWVAWTESHQYARAAIIGLGAYLNAAPGTLAQAQRCLQTGSGRSVIGVNLYSMANPATSGTSFADFVSFLTGSLFAQPAIVPSLPWKAVPRNGHLMGVIPGSDSIEVSVRNIDTRVVRTAETDGGGFFGLVNLEPGMYEAHIRLAAQSYLGTARVEAGRVAVMEMRVLDPHRRRPPR